MAGVLTVAQRVSVLVSSLVLLCCSSPRNTAAADDRWESLRVGSLTRSYLVHLPPENKRIGSLPLVIVLHGGGGNALSAAEQTGFDAEADRNGFIVVYPNGTGKPHPMLNAIGRGEMYTWNAGTCCGYAAQHNVGDVAFIRALIVELEKKYPIDRRRIYAAGISNGGMMAYRLACEMSETFAAIGVVAGVQTVECRPSQPVSVVHFHGTADQNVPLTGGVGAKALDKTPKPPVEESISFWVKFNRCRTQPQRESVTPSVTRYTYAAEGSTAEVVYYQIAGGGHAWPGGKRLLAILDEPTQEIAATPIIWQFFAAHPKQ
ncbi:MAG: alpha/beta hydrolase-fold protein [Chlorobi bacterium]|nr:alpha/beta hydrolase-fold protein [Chlorobiota bacterium]